LGQPFAPDLVRKTQDLIQQRSFGNNEVHAV
jgi:hypothetical protein